MVLRLARALDVPLRERNGLLLAAGFAPLYPVAPLGSTQLSRVEAALTSMLEQHEPYPAVVLDRGWNVLRANRGAGLLFARLFAPDQMPDAVNVLRLMLEPGPIRSSVLNWDAVALALLERAAGSSRRRLRPRPRGPRRATACATGHRRRPGRSGCRRADCAGHRRTVRGRRCRGRPVLGGVHDRYASRRHRPGTAGRGVLPRRRRHPSGLASDRH
jgi:MmyB-like transcription regulator ligand binding domain